MRPRSQAAAWTMERWPSGLRRTPGKRVHRKVSGVRIPVSPPEPTTNYARVSGRFHAKERGTRRSFGDGQQSRKAGHPQGGRVVRCGVCATPSGMRRLDATFRQWTLPGVERSVVHICSRPGAAIPVSPRKTMKISASALVFCVERACAKPASAQEWSSKKPA